jgi:hypothetical protein
MRTGDIYRWRYKDEKPEHLGAYKRYHCKSQIAIAKDGVLIDTYWGGSYGDSTHWSFTDAEAQLDQEYLGNFDELDKVEEYNRVYYDDKDIVDISHSNTSLRGNFYVRKGAKRSAGKMEKVLLERIETKEREVKFAQDSLARARQQLADLDDGKPLDEIWL